MKGKITSKLMWLAVIFFSFSTISNAQLSIQSNGFSPYQFKSSDVWSLIIINSSETEYNAEITAIIRNKNGVLIESKTAPTIISPGTNLISAVNIRIASLRYYDNSIKDIELQTGSLPPGDYSICFKVNCLNQSCYIESNTGGSDNGDLTCFNHHVESPSPLLLSYPSHLDTIKENRPVLIWIPPMPIGAQPGITYSLYLVKKNNEQSRTDAINRNRAIVSIDGLKTNTQPYPISLPELEQNSTYAWQVKAYLNEDFITASEVWEFSLKEEDIKKDTIKYYVMDGSSTGFGVTSSGVLYVKYKEIYLNNVPLSYKIYNAEHKEVFCPIIRINPDGTQNNKIILSLGINRYILDFKNSGLPPSEYYFEITNIKKETTRIKILYK